MSSSAGPGAEMARTGTSASTAASGPWRRSAEEKPSARMPHVSLIFSAVSSAAP